MKKLIPVACSALLIGSSTNSVLAEEVSGEKIYRYHGCINCHGAQGKNPVNSEVPNIGGRPADELFAATMKILAEGEKVVSQSLCTQLFSRLLNAMLHHRKKTSELSLIG